MRRTKDGAPVIRLHYSADPDLMQGPLVTSPHFPEPVPHKVAKLREGYISQPFWEREMNVQYEALDGSLVYPDFNPEIHVVPDSQIPAYGCRYFALDSHPRTPHAMLWLLVDRWDDFWFYREAWPSIVRGDPRHLMDSEQENQFVTWEYAETIAWLEGNEIEWRHAQTSKAYGIYRQLPGGERMEFRLADQAAKGFQVSAEGQQYETIATRYADAGITAMDPKKAHISGEDAVRAILKPRTNDMRGKLWPRAHFAESLIECITEFPMHRYKLTRRPNDERDLKQDRAESRCHMIDLVRYLASSDPGFHPSRAQSLDRYRLSDGSYQETKKAA